MMNREDVGAILGPMFDGLAHDGALALKALGLPEGAAVLDVGTGAGKFAIFLAMQGYDVLTGEPATDASRYAGKDWAETAEKVGVRDKIRFEPFDASAMPFNAGAFDAVFFFGVLHHVEEPARAAVLREAVRVAKSGGGVVFFEPRRETLEKLWVNDPDHPQAADPSDYVGDLAVRAQTLEGTLMDIVILRNAA